MIKILEGGTLQEVEVSGFYCFFSYLFFFTPVSTSGDHVLENSLDYFSNSAYHNANCDDFSVDF